jgi:branched-subunit amino acid transport protein
MNHLLLIFGLWALIFVIRLSGFTVRNLTLTAYWQSFFRYLPLGAFIALIVPSFSNGQGNLTRQLAGAAIAIAAVYFTKKLWAGILGGLLLYILLGLVL